MANEIEIGKCRVEDVDETVKESWLSLVVETFELEVFIVPLESNGVDELDLSVKVWLVGGSSC